MTKNVLATLGKCPKILKGAVGNCDCAEENLKFKDGVQKRHQHKLHVVVENHKPLMKEFLEDLFKQGVLCKAKSAVWINPIFCQGKKDGGISLLADLLKLNQLLQRDNLPF